MHTISKREEIAKQISELALKILEADKTHNCTPELAAKSAGTIVRLAWIEARNIESLPE